MADGSGSRAGVRVEVCVMDRALVAAMRFAAGVVLQQGLYSATGACYTETLTLASIRSSHVWGNWRMAAKLIRGSDGVC